MSHMISFPPLSNTCLSKYFVSAMCIMAFLLISSEVVFSAEVRLQWDAPTTNTDGSEITDLGGYKVYYGNSSGDYSTTINVGNTTTYTVMGLLDNSSYNFAVTAYNSSGAESTYSNEALHVPNAYDPDDIDGDGIPNNLDTDDDGDGISDTDEARYGTDPTLADSDNDGINDGQEIADGSDPLDSGSHMTHLGTTVCAEWNGFLGGMANVLEHVNLTSGRIKVDTTLFSLNNQAYSPYSFNVDGSGKIDLLVHDMQGRNTNSYGRICSTHRGNAGDIDGGMVHYKSDGANGYQFAIMSPLSMGKRGRQYLPFNTYNPSLATVDAGNAVANWIQITYLGTEESRGRGTLIFYDRNGTTLGSETVNLESGARQDFSGHQFGSSLIGLVEWIPDSIRTRFLIRNVRYFYDNHSGNDSFDSAFQLEGLYGTGKQLIVPVDTIQRTCVLELMNTTASEITTDVEIIGGNGWTFRAKIPAHGSRHYVLDQHLGQNQIGYAKIRSLSPRSIAAVAMHYGRKSNLGTEYVFAIPAKPALGSVLRGSYNTYLAQDSWLIIVSPQSQNISLNVTRGDGHTLHNGSLRVHGVTAVHLNQWDPSNSYGVITVQPDNPGSIVSWVLRRKGNDYIIPTPVR